MAAMLRCQGGVSARSAFLGQSAPQVHRPALISAAKRTATTPQALFGFGGGAKKEAGGSATNWSICVDCGWIYPDAAGISKAPAGFKCPACGSGKNRFKAYKGADVKGKPNNTGAAMNKRLAAKQW